MQPSPPRNLGRYTLYDEIASGGMASVYFGRLQASVGFSRTVAIKQLHPQFAKNPEFVTMFLDEARLAARVHHPNVVPTLDVVYEGGELFLVMEYVPGESLSRLHRAALSRGEKVPPRVAISLLANLLDGLHAAHEAKSEAGEPLGIVHRDISPQNLLVGVDGVARVLDFGVAKASGRLQVTREGQLKGKLAYMAPEQLEAGPFDRRADIFAAGVVLWELLAGRRLFDGASDAVVFGQILHLDITPPSGETPVLPQRLDAVVMKALAKAPEQRFSTAQEMAKALENALPPATPREVAAWVQGLAGVALKERADCISRIEGSFGGKTPSLSPFPAASAAAQGAPAEPPDDLPTRILTSPASSPGRDSTPSSLSSPGRDSIPSTPSSPGRDSAPSSGRDSARAVARIDSTPVSTRRPSSLAPLASSRHQKTIQSFQTAVLSEGEHPAMGVIRVLLLLSALGLIIAVLTPSGREGFAALAADIAGLSPFASSSAAAPTPAPSASVASTPSASSSTRAQPRPSRSHP